MAKIEVDIDGLLSNEKALAARTAELAALNSRVETLISRMEASWSGDASISYISNMRKYAQQAQNMKLVMEEFRSYVEKTEKTFSQLDKKLASKILNSF